MDDKENSKSVSSEEEFDIPSIEEVFKMTESTDYFFTDKEDNIYGLIFSSFKVRDAETGEVFVDVNGQTKEDFEKYYDKEIEYVFPHRLLKAKTIGTNIGLVIGSQPVKNIHFIERHYFDSRLLDSYSFKFPFFMPNSDNNIEFIYSVPKLPETIIDCMKCGQTFVTYSDTFVFVEDQLITHRKAKFYYLRDEEYNKAKK